MRLAIACDHAGFPYKAPMIARLKSDGHEVLDLGTSSAEPVDYPDFARLVGQAVREGRADLGILICGSGAGVSIAANKIRGIRAALCHDLFTARQSREDDDANVLCLGARVVTLEAAIELARTFVGARFSGAERHVRRLAKVLAIEASDLAACAPEARAASGDAATAPRQALARLERLDAGARIWRRDASLWSDAEAEQAAIGHRLGWLDAPDAMRERLGEVEALAAEVRAEGVTDVVLLGMGGSSLGAELLARTLAPADGAPRLTVLDTVDPGAVRGALGRLKLRQTRFVVSSKSGTTAEMLALYRFFRAEVERSVEEPGRCFVAITDPRTPLERLAADGGFRRVFLNPPDIGGRFSALSFFGLVPAALAGVDVAAVLERGRAMARACGPDVPVADNPALALAAFLAGHAASGRDKVTLLVSSRIRALGAWLEQLLAESTGKRGRGLVPVVDEMPGPPAVYGADRAVVAIGVGDDPGVETAAAAAEAAGHPVWRIRLADAFDIGGEIFRWELATAAAGALLGVNPFDEPNVAQAKDATQAALAAFRERGRLPEWPQDSVADLAHALRQANPGDYVALLAWIAPEPASGAALAALAALIRDRTRLATTVGYGPRYLHSTGQLHKGGPNTPILVLLTGDDRDDLPIPGERHGFAVLKMAQALGDLATLRAAHRRALWLPLDGPAPEAIDRVRLALARELG